MTAKFDPWDWLGVECGGWFQDVDNEIIEFLTTLASYEDHPTTPYAQLICTLLCNTDAFEFDSNPTELRFVGDERFKTLGGLIDAWSDWYEEHYR